MHRGPSAKKLLIEGLGFPKGDLNAVTKDIKKHLQNSEVGIHNASDEDLAILAHDYMAGVNAWTFFHDNGLNVQWSSADDRAKIEAAVRGVMSGQQGYALEEIPLSLEGKQDGALPRLSPPSRLVNAFSTSKSCH